jgi:YD repeat-containing protein
METFTYRPGIGLDSRSDVRGKLTYYKYDNAGRLQAILDETGDIVKSFGYNFYKP